MKGKKKSSARKIFRFQEGRTIVVVHYGPYSGSYPVYKSEESFRQDHPTDPIISPWYHGEEKSWVLCDDGHVAQILRISVLTNKRGQKTTLFRMPWSTFPHYVRKDGTTGSKMQFFKKQNTSKSSMAKKSTPRYGKHMNAKKRHFAVLVYGLNVQPHRAYMRAFQTTSIRTANFLSRQLMETESTELRSEVSKTIQEILDGAGMSLEKAALELKTLVEQNDNKNMKLSAIKAAINLHQHGMLPQPQGLTINTQNNNSVSPHQLSQGRVSGRSVSAPRLGRAEEADFSELDKSPAEEPLRLPLLEDNAARSQAKLDHMRERQELASKSE